MVKTLNTTLKMLRRAVKEFLSDDAIAYAAGVAFYTALSFAPLVLLLITIGGFLGDETQTDLLRFFKQQLGEQAAEVTETVVSQARGDRGTGRAAWHWVVSIGVLLFAASGVFAQLQRALNRIWEVHVRPGKGLFGWMRKRLLSMGLVVSILFILLVALVVTAVINQFVPSQRDAISRAINFVVSLIVFTTVFAAIFKILPDVSIGWSSTWVGAGLTAVLFAGGRVLIGLYLDRAPVGSNYGDAASSLIALLVWVYYSSIILFFGAEVAQQYARRAGRLQPEDHAEWTAEHEQRKATGN